MKIAIISKSDATGGGAGRCAETITKLLNEQDNIIAHQWIGYPSSRWQPFMRKLHGSKSGQFFYKSCLFLSRTIGLPDFLTPELFFHLYLKELDYDLYHFHDISTAFSPIAFRWIAKNKPVVWTFHDCSPFTAGCIYPMDCNKFHKRCGNCPQVSEWPLLTPIDLTGYMQDYKRTTAIQNLFQPVTPSEWLASEAMKSGMFNFKPQVIHNSVNLSIFKPIEKNTIRRVLGLPTDKFIVMINSISLKNKYKGVIHSITALRELSIINNKPYILSIGKLDLEATEFSGLDVKFLGYIENDQLLAQYYAAADVFLFPTLADNLPNVILETMACGTPTIAFSTGGVPEMIDHNITGWLTTPKNIKGLIEGLKVSMISKDKVKKWAYNGINKVRQDFNEEKMLSSYIDLYEKVIQKRQVATRII